MELKKKEEWFQKEDFGVLLPFVEDKNVTDIDWNGYALWITDLRKGRYYSNLEVPEKVVNDLTDRVANYNNKHLNKVDHVLEAQTETLRITVTHESVAVTGRSICIRKTPPEMRLTLESMREENYCSDEILNFLINCVKARLNFAFCGEPGVGKTECAKSFVKYIPESERIVTIEDTLEMRLHEICPYRDVIELLISRGFSYTDAIKHCLRLNPKWVILSEARSVEVKYLLEQWSTGLRGFTTLHLDDLRNLPDRVMNMLEKSEDADRLENNIYEYISVGVLIRMRPDGLTRFIDQVALYDRSNGENSIVLLVKEGKIQDEEIPERILNSMRIAGIRDPFFSIETAF